MSEKIEIIKFTPVKEYIKSTHQMRSSEDGVQEIVSKFNSLIESVISEAAKLAIEDKRKTIMLKDAQPALEKIVGKEHLTWDAILDEVLLQNPTDLGNISKGITNYIKEAEGTAIIKMDQTELSTLISKKFNLSKSKSDKITKYILDEISMT